MVKCIYRFKLKTFPIKTLWGEHNSKYVVICKDICKSKGLSSARVSMLVSTNNIRVLARPLRYILYYTLIKFLWDKMEK